MKNTLKIQKEARKQEKNKSKSTKMLESSPQVRESNKKLMHKRARGTSRFKKKSTIRRWVEEPTLI